MKQTLIHIGLLIVGASAVWPVTGQERTSRPNIVLIISDDQGGGDYGFLGHPQIQTPHLDALAKESLVFTRGYVPSSLCCPSLASIITGLYPHQHRITANDPPLVAGAPRDSRGSSPELTDRWNGLLDKAQTLPRLLAEGGYLSFQTGKWWHGDYARGGFTHGMTQGTRHGDEGLTIGRQGLQPIYEFVAQARREQKPFFVWYAPFMPHTPHTPPDRLLQKYIGQTPSLHVARYWAMCEWFDETCGELLAYLERERLAENTIVVYVTDNGWVQSPDRAAFAPKNKTTPFDLGHRTPLMMRWPGHAPPAQSESLAASIDILPTLLTAVGHKPPAGLPGVNLLDRQARAARTHVYGECFTVRSQSLDDLAANLLWRWVTDGRWRLIVPRTYQASGELKSIPTDSYLTADLRETLVAAQPMLFDIQADPREEHNLAAQHPEITATLLRQLDQWWQPR